MSSESRSNSFGTPSSANSRATFSRVMNEMASLYAAVSQVGPVGDRSQYVVAAVKPEAGPPLRQEKGRIILRAVANPNLGKDLVRGPDAAEDFMDDAVFAVLRTNLEGGTLQPPRIGITRVAFQFQVQRRIVSAERSLRTWSAAGSERSSRTTGRRKYQFLSQLRNIADLHVTRGFVYFSRAAIYPPRLAATRAICPIESRKHPAFGH